MLKPIQSLLAATLLLAASLPASGQSTVRPLPLERWRGLGARATKASLNTPEEEVPGGVSVEASFSPQKPQESNYARVRPFLELSGQAELGAGNGEFKVQRGGFDATLGETREHSEYALHVFTEASFYDFGKPRATSTMAVDPFNDLYRTGLGLEGSVDHSDDIAWHFGADFMLGGEDEASPRDSWQVGVYAAARYAPSKSSSLTLGVAAQTRLEDSTWLVPYLGFHWDASEDWSFDFEGPEGRVTYDLNQKWSANLVARYDLRQYRLNQAGPFEGGAFRDEEIRLTAGLTWHPRPGLEFSGEAGRIIWRELSLRDTDSHLLTEIEAEDANWVGLSLTVSF